MAKSTKKSKILESTKDQGDPNTKPIDLSESTESEPLSEEQINTMLDDIGNGTSSAVDHVESDQIADDVVLREAESMSETEDVSNVLESAVDPVVHHSIEEISNEVLQEKLDDQSTSDELESTLESDLSGISDDSNHIEPSMGEASEVMNGLDLDIESESNSINQKSTEEIDHENLQNASDEEHAVDEPRMKLDSSMTDHNEDSNHLDSDSSETQDAIDESELILESESHSIIHDSIEEIDQEGSRESSNEEVVSNEVQAETAQDDTGEAQLAAKEVHEALHMSSGGNEDPTIGVFDNSDPAAMHSIETPASEGLDENDSTQLDTKMTVDSQLPTEDIDDQLVIIHDENQSEPDSGTEESFLESTENEIVDLIEEQQQESIEEGTDDAEITDDNDIVIETSPQVDLIETNTPADQNLDDESNSDVEQSINSVSTAQPSPTEPLEQNHTNDEVLTTVDKTQSDRPDAQSERAIVSESVHSRLEPKSHSQKVNYLLVSGLALLAIVMTAVLGVYSFTLQSQIKDMEVMLASTEEKMEFISTRIDQLSATDEKIRRINVRLGRLGSKIRSIETPIIAKETSIENNEKPAKQDEMLPARTEQEPESGIQTRGPNNATIGGKSIENKPSALQPSNKQSSRSISSVQISPVQKSVVTPKSPAPNGDWSVNLISLSRKSSVEKLQTDFQKQGVMTKIKEVTIGGKQWYRLQVVGFSSKREAAAYVTQVEKKLGLNKVWVTHD